MAGTLVAKDIFDKDNAPGTNLTAHTPAPLNGFGGLGWYRASSFTDFTIALFNGAKFNAGTPRNVSLLKIETGSPENFEIFADFYYWDAQPYRMGLQFGLNVALGTLGTRWIELQWEVDTNNEHVNVTPVLDAGAGGGTTNVGHRYTNFGIGPSWGIRVGCTCVGPGATGTYTLWVEPFAGGTRQNVFTTTPGGVLTPTWLGLDVNHTSVGLHYENNGVRVQNLEVWESSPGTISALTPIGLSGLVGDPIVFDLEVYNTGGDALNLTIENISQPWLTIDHTDTTDSPQVFRLHVLDTSAMPEGISTVTFDIVDDAATNSPYTITVNVNLTGVPEISVASPVFVSTTQRRVLDAVLLPVLNVGGDAFEDLTVNNVFYLGPEVDWIYDLQVTGQTIYITLSSVDLPFGTYIATFQVHVSNASNTPQGVVVIFTFGPCFPTNFTCTPEPVEVEVTDDCIPEWIPVGTIPT